MTATPYHMDHDWYSGLVPANVRMGPDTFLESAYSLTMFRSQREPGLVMAEASGAYDQTAFIVGPAGRIDIGAFSCINSTTLICHERIEIGRHCLTAWGVVIMDTWPGPNTALPQRRAAMEAVASDPYRLLPSANEPRPVRLEDSVWVGFDAVVMPGVTLGRGCVIGCKTVVSEDVQPYTVVVGSPPRVVRRLDSDDTDEARTQSMKRYLSN